MSLIIIGWLFRIYHVAKVKFPFNVTVNSDKKKNSYPFHNYMNQKILNYYSSAFKFRFRKNKSEIDQFYVFQFKCNTHCLLCIMFKAISTQYISRINMMVMVMVVVFV